MGDRPLPSTLVREGAAMLRAVVGDFVALGAKVVTLRDARLEARLPTGVESIVAGGRFLDAFDACLATGDAALVIAPETGGVLTELTERVEAAGLLNLGSSSAAVSVAGDKLATLQRAAAAGVLVPPTWSVAEPAEVRALGLPVVLKPRDGAGAVGLRLVQDPARLDGCWAAASAESAAGVLAQRYVRGHHASVSLVCAEGEPSALSLNGQTIEEGESFEYQGGVVPLEHPAPARALDVAVRAARAIPGLRGYVGVDLVLGDEPVLMEINPRLTTAYVGLRAAVDQNLAGLLVAAAEGRRVAPPPLVRRIRFTAAGDVASAPLAPGR